MKFTVFSLDFIMHSICLRPIFVKQAQFLTRYFIKVLLTRLLILHGNKIDQFNVGELLMFVHIRFEELFID